MKMLWMASFLSLAACQSNAPVQQPQGQGVFLIGDSLRQEYAPYVQEALPCVEQTRGNDGSTWDVIAKMDTWLHDKRYHIIHANAGQWDIAHRSDLSTRRDKLYDPALAPIGTAKAEYAANVGEIVSYLQGHADIVIWATTTDVPDNSIGRVPSDVPVYNAIAVQVASGMYGTPIDDLYTLMLPHEQDHHLQNNNKVHYNDEGRKIMAAHVVEILKAYGGCH